MFKTLKTLKKKFNVSYGQKIHKNLDGPKFQQSVRNIIFVKKKCKKYQNI